MKKVLDAYINLNHTFISFLKVLFTSKFRRKIPKATSSEIFIIGTGPSLKPVLENHLDILMQHDLMAVNFFYKTEHFAQLKPKFYITAAPELWEDASNDHYKNLGDDFFNAIEKNVSWDMVFIMPYSARKFERWKRILKNKHIHLFYYNTTAVEGLKSSTRFLTRKGLGIPRAHNVLAHGLLNAWWMGYQKAYLLGADHTFFDGLKVNEKSEFVARNEHFYDKKKDDFRQIAITDRYTKKFHDHVFKLYLTFKGYWDILEITQRSDFKVYNLTKESMIDAFEKRDIESEFKQKA
jgi:hypothetical protein